MTVDVVTEDPRWDAMGLEALAKRAADATLTALDLDPDAFEIALLACDDARIARLNADFRGTPRPTNVLSWPSEDRAAAAEGTHPDRPSAPGELGDIALAFETCQREAAGQEKRPEDHVLHLLVHGILHLLGYDHLRDKDADLMESLEIAILGEIGVANPYM